MAEIIKHSACQNKQQRIHDKSIMYELVQANQHRTRKNILTIDLQYFGQHAGEHARCYDQ